MKPWWAVAFGVLCGFLGAGVILLISSPPRGAPVALLAPPTQSPLLVYVTGAVANPGVYNLPAGSRVMDAVEAAGGFLPEAQTASLNLAAQAVDGEKILVAARPAAAPASSAGAASTSAAPEGLATGVPGVISAVPEGPININTANQVELESLPGIGPALAGRIMAYREENGPFKTPEDIQKVSGIGPAIFERIKNLIIIE